MSRASFDSQGARDVLAERQRQIHAEGFDEAHDEDEFHSHGELAIAGACYAVGPEHVHVPEIITTPYFGFPNGVTKPRPDEITWPWHRDWWKPKDRRQNLVRAAALIIAEIDRLDRAALTRPESGGITTVRKPDIGACDDSD